MIVVNPERRRRRSTMNKEQGRGQQRSSRSNGTIPQKVTNALTGAGLGEVDRRQVAQTLYSTALELGLDCPDRLDSPVPKRR